MLVTEVGEAVGTSEVSVTTEPLAVTGTSDVTIVGTKEVAVVVDTTGLTMLMLT